jgi:hypothetical protein
MMLSITFQVIADKAPYLVANYGSYESMKQQLTKFMEAKIRDEMVKYTMADARVNRAQISDQILQSARPEIEERFFTRLQAVNLGEMRQRH